jgi:hypothetical protein
VTNICPRATRPESSFSLSALSALLAAAGVFGLRLPRVFRRAGLSAQYLFRDEHLSARNPAGIFFQLSAFSLSAFSTLRAPSSASR